MPEQRSQDDYAAELAEIEQQPLEDRAASYGKIHDDLRAILDETDTHRADD